MTREEELFVKITIRPFEKTDIPNKVKWINNERNNRFLHYELPLEIEKTENWFEKNRGRQDRFDAVIVADGIPCGTIGLLNIDRKNLKAEYYIAMGEVSLKNKGISTEATKQLLFFAFDSLGLNKVYLYTETENLPAQKLFEKIGFLKEGCLKEDLFLRGKFIDRFIYGIQKRDFFEKRMKEL